MSKKNRKPRPRPAVSDKPEAPGAFYEFEVEGKTYALPHPSLGAPKVSTQIIRDAVMTPDDMMAQTRLGFAMLEACTADDAAVAALYSLDMAGSQAVITDWMARAGGVELPSS